MRGVIAPLAKLGVFAVVTITATALLALTIANLDVNGATTYTARFRTVAGLHSGDDVRVAGVRVGQVGDLRIVDRDQAEVVLEVQRDVTLPAGVTATIKYRNLIGQRYVELGRGTATDINATLPPGARIPLDRTQPALDLTDLFNGFKPLFQALNPEDVNKLSFEIIQVLQGEGGTIDTLLAHTASLTSTIAGKDEVIGKVVDNLNSVLDSLNSRGDELSQVVVTTQQLISGLAADRKAIGSAIGALGDLADSTAGLLASARQPVKDDIAALGLLAGNLNDSKDVVRHFVQSLPDKLRGLTRSADYGSWANFYLCGVVGKPNPPRCAP
ncbi:MCE family protein [Solihabitans fulvus]|uniref:MCE family protein n=1 Tax=Solihabitans fulvus TaxID=1892852 RepID=A0A5B2WH41_9PSEU|nr:MCE family protein [Solihabitans fulvus]KAA2250188.1 MCE family protein [Solihabitans fulvus]